MEPRVWSRAEIEDLVSDRQFFLCDAAAQRVPVPGWMAAGSAGETPLAIAEIFERMHPDDQHLLLEAYHEGLDRSGEELRFQFRGDLGSGWRLFDTSVVNLIDQADAGGFVVVFRALGPVDAPG